MKWYTSTTGGGYNNIQSVTCAQPDYVIVGGDSNGIYDNAGSAAIGGGYNNKVSGVGATASSFNSSIWGGACNVVCGQASTIMGGFCNCLTGDCSAILGGACNFDGGLPLVGIYGCGIIATIPDAFYSNRFVVKDMPEPGSCFGSIVSRQLYYCCIAVGCCPVYIC